MSLSPPTSTTDRLAALFPDPHAPAPLRPWWRHRGRLAAAALVIVLVSVLIVTQAFGDSSEFRTAVATNRSVAATLQGVATIEPTDQATVAFPVGGTVASVGVKVGDTVTVGQTLASLDPQSLEATLHSKQATLAQAQLTLQQALSGQTITRGASGTGSPSSSATLRSLHTGAGASSTVALVSVRLTSADPELAAKQQAVLQAQQDVDAAITAAGTAMSAATPLCASPSTPADILACQNALSAVSAAQQDVKSKQDALVAASNALDALLQQRADASTTPTTSTTAPQSGGTQTSGRGGSTTRSGAGGSSPSAADLAAYQKAVDAAFVDVVVAQQGVAQGTIVTPISGTVVAVNLAVGDTVSAASTTANIVVQGPGGYEVATTVSVDHIRDVKVGQPATVIPDGTDKPIPGRVAYVSIVPQSSDTTTSYLVVVGLARSATKLDNGSAGTVAIVTDHARSALAVPTSAIRTVATRHTVQIPDGDGTKTVLVGVGVVGDRWTEVTRGLTSGEQVVLADLSEPLPGSATSSSNGAQTTFGGGRFPGGFGGRLGGTGRIRSG